MAAAWALTRVDPNCPEGSKKSVPCLVKGLFNPDAHVRFEAITSLQLLGPQAKEAVPALKKWPPTIPKPPFASPPARRLKRSISESFPSPFLPENVLFFRKRAVFPFLQGDLG